jgi:ADP-ribose pyrophosphatase
MEVHWVHVKDAVQQVLSGEIVNSTAVAGILAVHAVIVDGNPTRLVDTPFPDRPTAFAAGKARA